MSTSWLIATSEELPMLMVHGASMKEIRDRATGVIRRILENDGFVLDSVALEPPAPEDPTHFVTRGKTVTVVAVFEDAA